MPSDMHAEKSPRVTRERGSNMPVTRSTEAISGVNTAYGKNAPKNPSPRSDKWANDPNYAEISTRKR
jgi:hypothetical protein